MPDDCSHYFVDRSGGFGWPSCIKCGAPPPDTEPVRRYQDSIRRCCETPTTAAHTPTCNSMDARVRRGQKAIPT